ncbi:MAG: HAMP domain-containing sensor histidine kinase [Pseudomonadota bacterium]
MKVRTKFTVWISLTALATAVIFSTVVYFELLAESYKFVDKELNTVAGTVFSHMDFSEPLQDMQLHSQYDYLVERYWLKILDNGGRTIFTSPLAQKIDIPYKPGKDRYFVKEKILLSSLWIEPEELHDVEDITYHKVKFRVRAFAKKRAEENYTILIAKPLLLLDLELRELLTGLTSGICAMIALIFLANYFLAGRLLRPLTTINQEIKEIRESSLDRRIVLGKSRDELYTLSHSLNSMFDRLQHSFLRQKEFVGNAAHELKSPLTILMLGHEEMLAADPPEVIGQELEKQLYTMRRLSKLVRNLLEISRLEQDETCVREDIPLRNLIAQVLDDYNELLEEKSITVTTEITVESFVGDPEKILRLLINLVDNAIKYNIPEKGHIRIATKKSQGRLFFTIANTGPEIPVTDLPRIFDQFYRVEKSRSVTFGGAGLGLTIVRRIVELHGGSIEIKSNGGWTTCSITFPKEPEVSVGPVKKS